MLLIAANRGNAAGCNLDGKWCRFPGNCIENGNTIHPLQPLPLTPTGDLHWKREFKPTFIAVPFRNTAPDLAVPLTARNTSFYRHNCFHFEIVKKRPSRSLSQLDLACKMDFLWLEWFARTLSTQNPLYSQSPISCKISHLSKISYTWLRVRLR